MEPTENHQEDLASKILDLVKKYPLYSVDRLGHELPGVSRRLIQTTLEKNDLSTLEKRIAYAQVIEVKETKTDNKRPALNLKMSSLNPFVKVKAAFQGNFEPQWWRVGLLVIALLALWQAVSYATATPPAISLDEPAVKAENEGSQLYVAGQVKPAGSSVTINQEKVPVDGEGKFTAVIEIPQGESVLEVLASNKGKKVKMVRPVTRILSDEELKAQEELEAQKKKEVVDKMANLEKSVNDLLAAKNATNNPQKDALKVLNSQINPQGGFTNVTGEVINNGSSEVSWVMVTVNFYDATGSVVDNKFGFATGFKQTLKPGETAKFETQATTKPFDHYGLELSWQEGSVAGSSTEAAKPSPKPSSSVIE